MKMILAIIWQEDEALTVEDLNKKGFIVTKMATSGGFFKKRNTTLLIGTPEEQISEVLNILRKDAGKRDESEFHGPSASAAASMQMNNVSFPSQSDVGGCTVFIMDINQFQKL